MRLVIIIILLTALAACSQNDNWTSKRYVINNEREKNLDWIDSFIERKNNKKIKTYESVTTYSSSLNKTETKKYTFDSTSKLRVILRLESFGGKTHSTVTELDENGIAVQKTMLENGKLLRERKVLFNNDKSISEIQEFQNGKLTLTKKYHYKNINQFEIEEITPGDYQRNIIELNDKGKVIKYTSLSKANATLGHSINEYDEKGNNTYWKSIKNNEIDGETRWKYDSESRVIEQIDFLKSEDNYSNHELFKYDPSGEIIYHKTIDRWGDTVLIEKNILDDTIVSITRRNGLIERASKSTYLSKNRPLYIKTDFGNRITEFSYEYDSNGRIIGERRLTNGVLEYNKKLEWLHKEGLTLEMKEFRDDKIYSITKHTYEFF